MSSELHPRLQSPGAMLSDLRAMVLDEHATAQTRTRAIDLAYEIGKTQGYHAGKIEGINEMHEIQKQALASALKKAGERA